MYQDGTPLRKSQPRHGMPRGNLLQRQRILCILLQGLPRHTPRLHRHRDIRQVRRRYRQLDVAPSDMRFQHVPHLCRQERQSSRIQPPQRTPQDPRLCTRQPRRLQPRRLLHDHRLSRQHRPLPLQLGHTRAHHRIQPGSHRRPHRKAERMEALDGRRPFRSHQIRQQMGTFQQLLEEQHRHEQGRQGP